MSKWVAFTHLADNLINLLLSCGGISTFLVNMANRQNTFTVAPRYNAPRYYADSDITRSVVDPDFLPPGENAKWASLNQLRIALTILKKH